MTGAGGTRHSREYWDRTAPSYDRRLGPGERDLFRDSRLWTGSRVRGDALEVAVGTGLNLRFYPSEVRLTGLDLSAGMLAVARTRAAALSRPVGLIRASAHALPFADGSFDTVVCTLGLCAIGDNVAAIGEMARVLRPGGRLILVDHVASTWFPIRVAQRLVDVFCARWSGEHYSRRQLPQVTAAGLQVTEHERFSLGLIERLVAVKAA